MNRLLRHIALLVPALLVLASCSQTKNLPEDEYLYTGIKELSYGAPLKEPDPSEQTDSAGVITAMGRAASYVKQLLSGKQTDGKVRLRPDSTELTLTPREQDSLRILREKEPELQPREVFLPAPYRSEHDAMHLLYRIANLYEPLKILRLCPRLRAYLLNRN